MKSDKFECGDFTRENMPVQLLLAQVGHMYKWYVTNQMKDTELKAGQAGILAGRKRPADDKDPSDRTRREDSWQHA